VYAVAPLDLTLCVSTRNAGAELPGCLASVRGWVSEIVIVDMESSDDTLAIAEAHGALIVRVPAAGWAEPGRQAGIDAARCEWILVLDADERAGEGLRDVVAGFLARGDVDGVWLPRQNFQFGWWVAGAGIWPDWQLRLFRRERASWPVHRTHVGAQVDGRVEHAPMRVENAIVHRSFPSVSAWVSAMNRYTDLEADRYEAAGARPTLPRLLAVPAARFADDYVRRRGYRGGRYGLVVSLLTWVYWLIAELKLWQRRLSARDLPSGSVRLDADPSRSSSSPPDAR
jgi:(heptosyl)LPS beta-1,4-glucosyltransferase